MSKRESVSELVTHIKTMMAKHEIEHDDLAHDFASFVIGRQHSYFKKGMSSAVEAYQSARKKVFGNGR